MQSDTASVSKSFSLGSMFGITNVIGELERLLSDAISTWDESCDIRCLLEVASVPPDERDLSTRELSRLEELDGSPRRTSWLLGRAALKKLLTRHELGSDTSEISFPNKSYSLTHTDTIAIAMALTMNKSKRVNVIGVGMDFEEYRLLESKMLRFFLQPGELIPVKEGTNSHLPLQLWTIKEAVFKADPDNEGRMPGEYIIKDAGAAHGSAGDPADHTKHFAYASTNTIEGIMTIAIAFRENSHAQ